MKQPRTELVIGTLLFIVGMFYDLGLQQLMRPYARNGIYFQSWSSEDMMQTVSLEDLRSAPLQTLLYDHIQPPVFDLVRAILAQFWPSLEGPDLLERVDSSLYYLWALIFGLIGVVIFLWVFHQSGTTVAVLSALVFMLHPAAIFFATYLDATILSAFLVLWGFYLLWRVKNGFSVSIFLFSMAALLLFFTRSIFQQPVLAVFALSLFLFRVPRRQLVIFIILTGTISGLYMAKQRLLFGIFSTSSFAGLNLANSIGAGMGTAKYSSYLDQPGSLTSAETPLPDVLTSATKLNGQPNFNNIQYLYLNDLLFRQFEKALSKASLGDLASSYFENSVLYFRPSSSYSGNHVIVDRLPWTSFYDSVFSAPVLPVLLLLGMLVWVWRTAKARLFAQAIGLMLPGLYIFLVSILGDKGENMRFKFLLEPVMFVFLISQFGFVARTTYSQFIRSRNSP